MWNKRVGAQIMLYGSYVSAVLLLLAVLMMLFGGTMFATFMPGRVGAGGFFIGLFMALIALVVGGFVLWCMYSAGKTYLESGTFEQWKVWVVLVLSALNLIRSFGAHNFFAILVGIVINGIFVFGAAAMLFAEEESSGES